MYVEHAIDSQSGVYRGGEIQYYATSVHRTSRPLYSLLLYRVVINSSMAGLRGYVYNGPYTATNYLRGSMSKPARASRNVKDDIAYLKRRVAGLKPRLSSARTHTQVEDFAATAYGRYSYDVTGALTSLASWQQAVNGDQWTFSHMMMKGLTTFSCQQLRIVVYSPLRPGGEFLPPKDEIGFTQFADPAEFRVFYDGHADISNQNDFTDVFQRIVKLRVRCINNRSDSDKVEKGEIRILFLWQRQAGGDRGATVGFQFFFRDLN